MLIYLCLSSHGYGHASRQAAILSELHRLRPNWRIVVSSVVDIAFLRFAFRDVPVEHRRVKWDVGIEQNNAIEVDYKRTILSIQEIENNLPDIIQVEANWIKNQNTPGIIIGDIPSSAACLSIATGLDLIWVGNFGWDDIYSPIKGYLADYAKLCCERYRKGNLLLRCPFSLRMQWFLEEINLGLTAAVPQKIPEKLKLSINSFQGPKVMIGFGGFGFDLDPKLFSLWEDTLFILPYSKKKEDYRKFINKNVITLQSNVMLIDALPYCSRLIGKPGYSSFCEAISQEVGLHVVNRIGFEETKALIEGLRLNSFHRLLEKKDLLSGNWQLNEPLLSPEVGKINNDGAINGAKHIIKYLSTKA